LKTFAFSNGDLKNFLQGLPPIIRRTQKARKPILF
jgi:hypothetical protein